MAAFDRRSPGDPFAQYAAEINLWNENAREFRSRRAGRIDSGPLASPVLPANTVLVRNDTGASLPFAYSVLAIGDTDPLVSVVDDPHDFQRRPPYTGTVPVWVATPFVVTLEPIPADGIGRAVLDGMVVCEVDISDENHHYARPTPGVTLRLESACSGPAKIIWRAGGRGTVACVVQLGPGGCSEEWAVERYTLDGLGTAFAYQFTNTLPITQPPLFHNWTAVVVAKDVLLPPFPVGAFCHCQVAVRFQTTKITGFTSLTINLLMIRYETGPTFGFTDTVPIYEGLAAPVKTGVGQLNWLGKGIRASNGKAWVPVITMSGTAAIGTTVEGIVTVYGIGSGPTALWWEERCCEPDTYIPEITDPLDPLDPLDTRTPPVADPTADPTDLKVVAGTSLAFTANPSGGRNYPAAVYTGFTWYTRPVDAVRGTDDTWKAATENPTIALDETGEFYVDVYFQDDDDPPVQGYGTYGPIEVIVNPDRDVTATGDITTTDRLIQADASGGAIVLTLPDAGDWVTGDQVTVTKDDVGGNTVTVQAFGVQTVKGTAGSLILATFGDSVTLRRSSATSWVIVAAT